MRGLFVQTNLTIKSFHHESETTKESCILCINIFDVKALSSSRCDFD